MKFLQFFEDNNHEFCHIRATTVFSLVLIVIAVIAAVIGFIVGKNWTLPISHFGTLAGMATGTSLTTAITEPKTNDTPVA